MPARWEQPFARETTGLLNTVNDTVAGGESSISGAARYAAIVGQRIYQDHLSARYSTTAPQLSLYGGGFQYVQSKTGSTAAPAVGVPAFWSDFENYIVTPDTTTTNVAKFAGVYLNAISKGNWGFIQIKGKVYALFRSTITAATPADGDLITIDYTTSGLFDDPTQSTSVTYALMKTVVGVALGAPVTNTTNLILLRYGNDVI